MKGVITIFAFVFVLMGLNGCYTIPHHFADDEEVVYYPPIEPYIPDPIIIVIDYPPPLPSPPINLPAPERNLPKDRQPEKPKDSYDSRDPLQGGSGRGSGEINIVPPVRTPERKDRGQR